MAGWSKIVDGSALACFKAIQNLQKGELLFHLKPGSVQGGGVSELDKIRLIFNRFLTLFHIEICGTDCLRTLPPMLGNGQSMDLFKLYLVVRRNGGYEIVSKNKLWGSVAKECGLDSRVGSAVKLIYVKYLGSLDRWLLKIAKDKKLDSVDLGKISMDLESDIKCFLSEMPNQKLKDGEDPHLDLSKAELCSTGVEKLRKLSEVRVSSANADDERGLFGDVTGNPTLDCNVIKEDVVYEQRVVVNDAKDDLILGSNVVEFDNKRSVVNGKKLSACLSPDVVKEDDNTRKRKRECYSGLLNWVKQIAKEPCDAAIGHLPDRSKWNNYGNEHLWKLVLLAREAMCIRVNADSSAEQSIWQIKQKMHPTMYEDHSGSERLRCSQRILSAKESRLVSAKKSKATNGSESSSSANQSDLDNQSDPSTADSVVGLWVNNYSRKRIPLGPLFQAELPEWSGETYQGDSKWLGIRIWPLEKGLHNNLLIERDRIGKGRQDSCGCQFRGSVECVRFHVAEKRVKVKLELSSAFYQWRLNEMGEEVSLSWTKEEGKNFLAVVKSNPLSQDKNFWNELYKLFPGKRRQDLVSYYFNVFLLQRRAYQNRTSPSNIDSDDDESEFGSAAKGFGREAVVSPGSIFCSPKKPHLNFR